MSPWFIASSRRRNTSIRSGVVDSSSAISPLLCEAFGSSTGLVDVGFGVEGDPCDQAVYPLAEGCSTHSNVVGATDGTPLLVVDGQHHAVPEVEDFVGLDCQVLERAGPLLQESGRRLSAIEGAHSIHSAVHHDVGAAV